MKATYLQFETPENNTEITKERPLSRWFNKIFISVLTKVFPIANPDFEDKIGDVKYWLLECDTETGIPEREIGLDANGQVILKMPYKENYGYWTDTNLLLSGFKEHFVTQEISEEIFEFKWKVFDEQQL